MIRRLLLAAVLLLIHCELRAEPSEAEKNGFFPRLIIYSARGPADSCGPGCDRWIAVEGQVDEGAAARVRRFLADIKDTRRPIYFHSPGGAVGPSYVIGRLLRSRNAVARIGRTTVKACAGGTQVDAACLKIKSAAGEVEAEITTRGAMCNSACSYLFLGARTREVEADAAMGVHNSRLTLVVHGHIPAQQVAAFRERGMEKANRERAAFIASMGIDLDLDDLIKTVKFESVHILTRSELYSFNIDRRTAIEGAWSTEVWPRNTMFKSALVKKVDGSDFNRIGWRLACAGGDRARFTFLSQFDKDAPRTGSVALRFGTDKRLPFENPVRSSDYEFWNVVMTPDTLKILFETPRVLLEEKPAATDGTPVVGRLKFDTAGLEDGWKKVSASCGVGEPAKVPRASGLPAFVASPAAQSVKTAPPEPGSVWPNVTANSPPENKVDP